MLRLIFVCLALAASAASSQDNAEVALVKRIFAVVQPVSIRENREYCGYIGFDRAGILAATIAAPGSIGSCLPDDPLMLAVITASYHTHGAVSPDYFNELPSGEDMEGDESEGIDGYVATPGGRLWYVDTTDMVTSQLCGIGCLPRDARFIDGADGLIAQSYSYRDLVRKLAE